MTARGRPAAPAAGAFLESRGLRILARNWRCRFGEIDLVAKEGAAVVFVEVRMRSSASFGGAAESIVRPSAGASSPRPTFISPRAGSMRRAASTPS